MGHQKDDKKNQKDEGREKRGVLKFGTLKGDFLKYIYLAHVMR